MHVLKDTSDTLVTEDRQIVTKKVLTGRIRLAGKLSPQKLVQREVRALQFLRDIPQVQHLRVKISDTIFQSDLISYPSLRQRQQIPLSFFDKLRELMNRIESQGVFLVGKNREDILIKPDGNPFLIDFGDIIFGDEHPVQIACAQQYTRWRINNLEKRFKRR